MWWRPKFVQYAFLTLGVATCSTMILASLMLLPAILNGPSNVNYLERGRCVVENITYLPNLCLRDTNNDFSNLEYNPHWEQCKLVQFEISNNLGSNCSWIFPEFFQTEQEAYIAISQNFDVGTSYNCIINTIENICYKDQHEVTIYAVLISSLGAIGCCAWCVFAFLRVKWKRRLR